ncbi:MAG: YHYH protein [Verrucomicrobiota bacterium]
MKTPSWAMTERPPEGSPPGGPWGANHPAPRCLRWAALLGCLAVPAAVGHDWHRGEEARQVAGAPLLLAEATLIAEERTAFELVAAAIPGPTAVEVVRPGIATAFAPFAPRVKTRWDDRYLYVESNGLPDHGMMVGITAWQQQVPLPQPYVGANAWRLPRNPVPAVQPVSIRDRFLRGAIALAANGIPIFNPQNNRGEISQEIGELDQWGGHCGRADDYHYHAAPLHLQKILGRGRPVAIALDGYPVYGLSDPDGSVPVGLDAFRGHETGALGYHYHASTNYPYVQGGFHGVVVEREGQVDPQPRAQPVRPDKPPLRGARITSFHAATNHQSFSLQYTVNGRPASLEYSLGADGRWTFRHAEPDGSTREETHRPGERRGGGGQPPGGRPGGRRPQP